MVDRSPPWRAAAVEAIRNGPVSLNKVLAEAAALVPPGRGYRESLYGVTGRRYYVDQEAIKSKRVRGGQMKIVRKTLFELVESKRVLVTEVDGVKMLAEGPAGLNGVVAIAPSKLSPQALEMLRIIRDEGPTPMRGLVERGMAHAPHDVSVSTAIRARNADRRRRGVQTPAPTQSDEHNFLVGARAITKSSLTNLINSGRLSVSGEGADATVSTGPRWRDPDAI